MQTWEDIIPIRYRRHSVDSFPAPLNAWPWKDGRGPLIYGPKGTGKSCAASAVMMSSGVHPYHCRWVSLVTMFADMRRRMNGVEVDLPDFTNARLVLLDDVGKERPSEWVQEQTFELMENLYRREVSVIVTSNINPDQLEWQLGEFVHDRLKDMTLAVPMLGESKRGAA